MLELVSRNLVLGYRALAQRDLLHTTAGDKPMILEHGMSVGSSIKSGLLFSVAVVMFARLGH